MTRWLYLTCQRIVLLLLLPLLALSGAQAEEPPLQHLCSSQRIENKIPLWPVRCVESFSNDFLARLARVVKTTRPYSVYSIVIPRLGSCCRSFNDQYGVALLLLWSRCMLYWCASVARCAK